MEGTFHAARAHLGVETQRHWSERAFARATPALLGFFSLVTLLAHPPMTSRTVSLRASSADRLVHQDDADLQRRAGARP